MKTVNSIIFQRNEVIEILEKEMLLLATQAFQNQEEIKLVHPSKLDYHALAKKFFQLKENYLGVYLWQITKSILFLWKLLELECFLFA